MKKETTVFVRVPIMAFGILLLISNCALAQKELVIEYTAESERMRCTIEEYVQNGDEIKYSVQDEPADIQIMTYKQMQKAAENGDILPIEIDDVPSTIKFGNDVYGCAIKNYRTEFKVQNLELWKEMGLSVPEKELNWEVLLEIADKVSDYNDEHGTNLYVLENSSRFPNSPLFSQKDGSELWSRISEYISADKETALFKEVILETPDFFLPKMWALFRLIVVSHPKQEWSAYIKMVCGYMLIDAALAGVLVVVAKRMEMPIYAANKN